ncbi:MAG: hypothetical protein AMXMBFR7_22980 [Planctomycetota bacterium]
MKAAAGAVLLIAAVLAAGEWIGPRADVYAGALGGGLLGAVGFVCGWVIKTRHARAQAKSAGKKDIWGVWGAGFLLRLALLGGLSWGFSAWRGPEFKTALLTMAATYLALLFLESYWLMQVLVDQGSTESSSERHG